MCRGGSKNSGKGGGSKIKFMKGVGAGGGVLPTCGGAWGTAPAAFLVSHLFGMNPFHNDTVPKELILTASSITFELATLKKG